MISIISVVKFLSICIYVCLCIHIFISNSLTFHGKILQNVASERKKKKFFFQSSLHALPTTLPLWIRIFYSEKPTWNLNNKSKSGFLATSKMVLESDPKTKRMN